MPFVTTIKVYNNKNDNRTFLRQWYKISLIVTRRNLSRNPFFDLTKACFDDETEFDIDDVEVGFVGATADSFTSTTS